MEYLVTVIMAVYNVDKYIYCSLESLYNQSYKNIEVIIVDDSSDDETSSKINEFIKNHSKMKIRLINNNVNIGTFRSLNTALMNSRGNYITKLDGDDTFHKDKILNQLECFNQNPDLVACYTDYNRVYEDNTIKSRHKNGECTIMFSKKLLSEIGYFDSVRFGGDSEYYHRIYAKYPKETIMNLEKVLYYAKYRENSLTTSGISSMMSEKGLKLRTEYYNTFKKWHQECENLYMSFNYLLNRPFCVNSEIL